MMQERIFELAKKAGLTRVVTCCEGVENKLCANDQWKGNLGAFAAEVQFEERKRIIAKTTGRNGELQSKITDYKAFLEHSFERSQEHACCPATSRLSWLGDAIFDFTTYDAGQSELMAIKALEVCHAISAGETFKYIEDQENYTWYLLMCNHKFFESKIEWGTSIRGAWWDHGLDKHPFEIDSCELYVGDDQFYPLTFTDRDEWLKFVDAMIHFIAEDPKLEVASS